MTYRILYRDKRGNMLVWPNVRNLDAVSRKLLKRGATALTARIEVGR